MKKKTMTLNEANQKWLELHATAGDRMLDEYNQDYIDWLSDEEKELACEVERIKFGEESVCICGQHEERL